MFPLQTLRVDCAVLIRFRKLAPRPQPSSIVPQGQETKETGPRQGTQHATTYTDSQILKQWLREVHSTAGQDTPKESYEVRVRQSLSKTSYCI